MSSPGNQVKTRMFLLLCVLLIADVLSASVAIPTSADAYCANGAWLGPSSDAGVALPLYCVNTSAASTPSNGAQIAVPAGADINIYLAGADCGDTLLLAPGQYAPFTLPAKTCDMNHWITIQSSATGLPDVNTRITPCYAGLASLAGRPAYACPQPAAVMATITTSSNKAITVTTGANYYKIGPGIEITRAPISKVTIDLVVLAGSDHVVFDRDWIHGTEAADETHSGIDLDGATNIAVVNSYFNDFKCIAGKGGSCTDAHAICGGDDPMGLPEGTWKIVNNFIEASGEDILFGGNTRGTTTPSDIEIRLNHFYKVPGWNTHSPGYTPAYAGFEGYIVKNITEFKNAERVLLEGNRMEYSWGGYTQDGSAILFTPRGAWGHVYDITVRYNYISHVGSGFQIAATRNCTPSATAPTLCKNGGDPVTDSGGTARVSLHDTLTDDVDAEYYLGNGTMAQVTSALRTNAPLNNVVLNHNTFVTNGTEGNILALGTLPTNPQPQMGPVTFTNNIVRAGTYNGIWQTGKPLECATDGNPVATFAKCFARATVEGNLIVGWGAIKKAAAWPAGNQTPISYNTVFVNPLLFDGNYQVLPPYVGAGTDGHDIGADITGLMQVMLSAE